jgi:hypothetical protein
LIVTFAVIALVIAGVAAYFSAKLSKIKAAREPEAIVYEESYDPPK